LDLYGIVYLDKLSFWNGFRGTPRVTHYAEKQRPRMNLRLHEAP